jgi:hypothetical protein
MWGAVRRLRIQAVLIEPTYQTLDKSLLDKLESRRRPWWDGGGEANPLATPYRYLMGLLRAWGRWPAAPDGADTTAWLSKATNIIGVHHSANEFARGRRHINGIESFWSYAKTRLARLRGIRSIAFFPTSRKPNGASITDMITSTKPYSKTSPLTL